MDKNQFLEKLNSINEQKTFIKLSELEIGNEYLITDVEGINTKYGYKTFLELDSKFKVILPDKYKKVLSWGEEKERMIGLRMVYHGTKEVNGGNKAHNLKFSQKRKIYGFNG